MENLYQETFDEIHASEALRQEVMNLTGQERKSPRRHKLTAVMLAAAIVVIALMGTAVAALVVPGTIQEWFAGQWDGPMEEGQTELIDRLTQEIGVSDTDNGVTVTVDSATVGDSTLWLLLKTDLTTAEHLDFQTLELEFLPDPDQVQTPGGYDHQIVYEGIAEDGMLTLLVHYTIDLIGDASLLDGYEAGLHLENMRCGTSVIQEGAWDLSFPLEPVEQAVLKLERVTVPAYDEKLEKKTDVELWDVRISATGIRYTQAAEDQMCRPLLEGLVLKDGTEAHSSGGAARWTENGLWASDFYWRLPVDTSQVTGVRFGKTVVPLN